MLRLESPVVFNAITRCGARAVPEPWSATTGSVNASNSAIPPVVTVFGFIWFPSTLTGVAEPSQPRPRSVTAAPFGPEGAWRGSTWLWGLSPRGAKRAHWGHVRGTVPNERRPGRVGTVPTGRRLGWGRDARASLDRRGAGA